MSEYESLGTHIIEVTTTLAIGVDLGDGVVWLPRSVVEYGDDMEAGETHDISVKTWFAEKEALV